MLLHYKYIKPFVPNAHFLHSLKTSENDKFLCFQVIEKGCTGNK